MLATPVPLQRPSATQLEQPKVPRSTHGYCIGQSQKPSGALGGDEGEGGGGDVRGAGNVGGAGGRLAEGASSAICCMTVVNARSW